MAKYCIYIISWFIWASFSVFSFTINRSLGAAAADAANERLQRFSQPASVRTAHFLDSSSLILINSDSEQIVIAMPGVRVFIGNISDSCRERDVERFFKGYGRLRDVVLKSGYGFVEFEDSR